MAPPFGYPKTKNLSALPLDPAGGQGLKGVYRVQPDDYGWQQDEYKLQNGQMDTLFVL